MIQPILQDEAFLAAVSAGRRRTDDLQLWWLGQSGYLVQWAGEQVLVDPYLSEALTLKYAGTARPHVRMTARVVDPARLAPVLAVTASHQHTDHLDAATLQPVMAANPGVRVLVPAAWHEFAAERLQVPAARLHPVDAGQSIDVGPFRFHPVPAAHPGLDRDDAGHYKYLGQIIECGPWVIYHSGDTLRFPGMAEALRRWRIDVAILPINGDRPERGVAGNLDGPQAAELARDIGARLVIPCHYEMFEFNTASPADFAAACRSLGQPHHVLRAGEGWTSRGWGT